MKELVFIEERRDFYRTKAHDQGNEIMDLADQLSTALRELEALRHKPDDESPVKEA